MPLWGFSNGTKRKEKKRKEEKRKKRRKIPKIVVTTFAAANRLHSDRWDQNKKIRTRGEKYQK